MKHVKKKLKKGEVSIGSWMQIPSVEIAEIMGHAGYDWVVIDMEHGTFPLDMIPAMCLALESGGTIPFARVAQASLKDIKKVLDAGVRGLIIPMIENENDLEYAISWAKYPPNGIRGVGYSRANLFGKRFQDCVPEDSDQLVIVAQIENRSAVDSLDAILLVEGLDAIMIGPYDLSASLGITGKFDHPEFKKTVGAISEKAKKYGITVGFHIVQPNIDLLKEMIEKGYHFIAFGIDAVFLYQSAECPKLK